MKNSDGVMKNGMPRRSGRSMDFEKLYERGESPSGFRAETANGTAHWNQVGWNQDMQTKSPEAKTGGAWQGRRSTRTGE